MTYPSPSIYKNFFRYLEEIDQPLYELCLEQHLQLFRNHRRWPCRILQRLGNPSVQLIIGLNEDCYDADIADLPAKISQDFRHTIELKAYFQTDQDAEFVSRVRANSPNSLGLIADRRFIKTQVMDKDCTLQRIRNNLFTLVAQGLLTASSWPVPEIVESGHEILYGWRRTKHWIS